MRYCVDPIHKFQFPRLEQPGPPCLFCVRDRLNRIAVSAHTDVTLQTAEFDGKGRRIKNVVTNSGDFDRTEVYLWDGWKLCETRDGSANVVQQFIHGTQYIDELIMLN